MTDKPNLRVKNNWYGYFIRIFRQKKTPALSLQNDYRFWKIMLSYQFGFLEFQIIL